MGYFSKLGREVHGRTRRRVAGSVIGVASAMTVAAAVATPAMAPVSDAHYYRWPVQLVVVTPSPGDVAGANGVFNIDVALLGRSGTGNNILSAANGYRPGINAKPGIGHPDPFAPGLVVLLSTTPAAAGGPDANLAGVFQLTDVVNSNGQAQVIADWEVGKAGAFGDGTRTTLTAFLVNGTAPGILSGTVRSISNVIRETFTIGG
jgi:hypothetical protein